MSVTVIQKKCSHHQNCQALPPEKKLVVFQCISTWCVPGSMRLSLLHLFLQHGGRGPVRIMATMIRLKLFLTPWRNSFSVQLITVWKTGLGICSVVLFWAVTQRLISFLPGSVDVYLGNMRNICSGANLALSLAVPGASQTRKWAPPRMGPTWMWWSKLSWRSVPAPLNQL